MGAIPIFKGLKLRATRVDSCGKPIEGNANRIVTDGFISVKLSPEMKARQEVEQPNAEGRIIFSGTTPATRKHHNADINMCGVDPELYTFLTGYELLLDYNGNPIGYGDKPEVEGQYGAVIEVWAGGKTDDDCDVPEDDSYLTAAGAGLRYGYLAFAASEWVPTGDLTIEDAMTNLSLTAITQTMVGWHRGPYNVQEINDDLDAGRLLVAVPKKRHITFLRTRIAPPEVTPGLVPLSIQSIFTDPDFYAGGPANEPAADVAPDQIDALTTVVTLTGSPDSGNFTLLFNGLPTATIAYNAANSAVKSALIGVDDGYSVSDFSVSGDNGGPWTVTHPFGTTIEAGTNSLGGGTDPGIEVS